MASHLSVTPRKAVEEPVCETKKMFRKGDRVWDGAYAWWGYHQSFIERVPDAE